VPGLPIARAGMAAVCFSLAAGLINPAFARDKTDVVVLKNGDRITCEVKKLENGVLNVNLDYVDGTIGIDWLKVARLESNALFLVQLQDSSIYSAKVVSQPVIPGNPVEIELQPVGQKPFVVDRSTVVGMTQTSDALLQRFSGNINLGSTYSKGNNNTQYNIGSELDYQEKRWGARLSYGSNLSSSTGANKSTRNQLDMLAFRKMRWENYFYAGTLGFLQSSVQGIAQQTSIGGGVGRFLKNTNRVRFSVLGGLGWQRDNYSPAANHDQAQNTAVALIISNLQVFSFKKTRLSIQGTMAPTLGQQGRIFSRVNAVYYVKLFGKVDWNLSFYGNWDTQPPVHLPSSDYGTTTGLSWTFGNQ